MIQINAPTLGQFLIGEGRPHGMILPAEARDLLVDIVGTSEACFKRADPALYSRATVVKAHKAQEAAAMEWNEPTNGWSPEEEFMRTGFYYPNLPIVRHTARYLADFRSQRSGQTCTKYHYESKNLAPGLFLIHCLRCFTCVGFHLMSQHESPQTLFEVLYTRWQAAPRLVVYDNSCHGHTYFLNREPAWVRDTRFLIDKMHFKGHSGCCEAYDIAKYPELSKYNSQLAEQRNSRLAILKSHCAYMTQPMFLLYVRFFLFMSAMLRVSQSQT
ncbi:hypothetical protein Vafri_22208 [Volvox africanus]|uniref:Uncharacterized protein n=1 Tax=Volvox africanus TaxID=51714 RepID=A0A8J4C087_9CHLO|nr:hypothetical protein Vafri_22208 [Volvox africanus]